MTAVSVDFWATQFLNGVTLGMIFVLVALGLSLIFGIMHVVNFAHGDLLLVGTYVSLSVFLLTDSLLLGGIAAVLAVGVLGFVLEYYILRRVDHENVLLQLLVTFGAAEIIRELVQLRWGSVGMNYPVPSWGRGNVNLLVTGYPLYRTFVIVAGVVCVAAVYLFLTRTDYGLVIRAGSHDRELVRTLGIDITRIFTLVFVIGCLLAAVAGTLVGPLRSANPELGVELLIPAFVVVIVGGMGSFTGSIVAGLFIGLVITLTGVVFPPAQNAVIYAFMALVLLVRPHGLFGTPQEAH